MSGFHPRKRMRLSSPTFDDQVGDLSRDDIDAFDSLDAQLSQAIARPPRPFPVDEDENPFRSDSLATPGTQTLRIHAAFTSASALDTMIVPAQDVPDDVPPEVDYATWFNTDVSNSLAGFSTAATVMPGFQRPSVKSGNAKPLLIPSAAALSVAEEKMRKWQEEDVEQVPAHKEPDPPHVVQVVSPPRVTFSSARNAFSSKRLPETPTPAPLFKSANAEPTPIELHGLLKSLGSKGQTKPFKTPLISATPSIASHRQLFTPITDSPLRDHHSSATDPYLTTMAISPLRPSLIANHAVAQKPLGFTPRHGAAVTRAKFVTPFKAVAKAGASGPSVFENLQVSQTPCIPKATVSRIYPPSISVAPPSKRNTNRKLFDLTPPSGRRTLATSGLRPQSYSARQAGEMGIDFHELGQVNPRTAPFYAFATRERISLDPFDPSLSPFFGRSDVLEELHTKGCTLATQAWIDNHWLLVLWKLSGMAALDPQSEQHPPTKRWCWPEVVRQLMYRYERDLNGSSRPPFRLITTRDASAESPMILCISDIILPPNGSGEDFPRVSILPELEVTDGWYRLRARIDAPLARGIKKGKIKIGRKIAVVGAKLSAERKEGCEILEAYASNVLLLTGNSTHMAPWHAKLGFQLGPFIATLNSLTADGGNVAAMMFKVIKAHPVAYIEFTEDTDGKKQRQGPHDVKEELKLSAQRKTKRESVALRLWCEYEKRRQRLLDHAERLEQYAGSKFSPRHDDGLPDKIYDMYDTLQEDPDATKNILSSISHEDAGWLARHIREKAVQERDEVARDIEQELESTCPPRDVRAFCVVVVKDSRTYKHPCKLTAQVTIWDVPGLSTSECSGQNPFSPGQRYLVTNLVPTQPSAWMHRASDGEVYLSTRKNSKWTLIN
ncbi:hypothetical protein JVU11DRAFT_4892 [Chiua virens]|nr:hypothetical protein JVU11DRAFT_4892 [Chiua virens]